MKVMTKAGASRATQHKSVITSDDLKKKLLILSSCLIIPLVVQSLCSSCISGLEISSPTPLRFVQFSFDEDDKEYVVLRHETQQKNFQGGLSSDEAPSDKRIYAVPECPTCTSASFV